MATLRFGDPVWLTHTSITTPGAGFYRIKEFLKSAGWLAKGSGDGLSIYSSSADILTSAGSGANGCNNAKAWIRMSDPSGANEITVQIIETTAGTLATQSAFRIRWSQTSTFTGGSPGFDQAPTATGALTETVMGGGTAGSPTGVSLFHWGVNPLYIFGGADRNPPYSFYTAAIYGDTGTSSAFTAAHGLFLSSVTSVIDDDPSLYLWYASGWTGSGVGAWLGTDSMDTSGAVGGNTQLRAYNQFSVWQAFGAKLIGSAFPGGINIASPLHIATPLLLGSNEVKGWPDMFVYIGRSDSGAGSARARVYNHPSGGTANLIRIGSCLVPWNGTVPSSPGSWSNGGSVRLWTGDFIRNIVIPE